ncbi:YoaK family protein [Variovorax sp. dw_308]|uniref:YoaK family protein n=1 Tax=Variovorax sp. dw_308 TaxID=2721546 RepID=UPI001C46942F|nr:YoaK family protein [Variovorax sp. dw_308]
MRRLLLLTNRHRAPSTNVGLGLLLAFNAGAVNAGGFLVLGMYTSHMTGFASQIADGLVLGNMKLVLNASGAILAFIVGAGTCAALVNWSRRYRLHSVYALPLLLEAGLMFPFGLAGAITLTWSTPFAVPMTVLLLSFIMGLQNAVGSKTSGGSVRTTHMTGNITDLGMELGKWFYWRRSGKRPSPVQVRRNRERIRIAGGLAAMFVLGGITGALGFKHVGFVFVVPLAALLLGLSVPPLLRDLPRSRRLIARLSANASREAER